MPQPYLLAHHHLQYWGLCYFHPSPTVFQQSDLVSTFILPRQMRSALNLFFSVLNTSVVLCPSFSLSSSLFTLHDQVCTQSAMWRPIWHCPMALTFYNLLLKNIFPPFQFDISTANIFSSLNCKLLKYKFRFISETHGFEFCCSIWVHVYSSSPWGHASISGLYSKLSLIDNTQWCLPWLNLITLMPSYLMKTKMNSKKYDSCFHVIPSSAFFLLKTILCFLSFMPLFIVYNFSVFSFDNLSVDYSHIIKFQKSRQYSARSSPENHLISCIKLSRDSGTIFDEMLLHLTCFPFTCL